MRPDNTPTPTPDPRGQVTPPARDHTAQHDAVANMTREQINQIYQQRQPDTQPDSIYYRTHTANQRTVTPEWQQYHSSWQQYYQKYYERYYVSEAQRAHDTYKKHIDALGAAQPSADESISEDEALYDLRSQLVEKVRSSATKARKSRHFVPIISGLCVLLIFSFIQYNSVFFAYAKAYVSPGSIDPQDIIVDPTLSLSVSKEPRLIIPKINVDVNVNYDATPDNESQMKAMETGVAYFGIAGANSKPGQNGNVPIAGHSSNDALAPGDAAVKFIFAQLEQMKVGDTFYLNYKGIRYTYSVSKIMVVKPSQVTKLQIGKDKPYATLITCTPLGTAEKRLLVFGEQISPSPTQAKKAPASTGTSSETAELAGKSPTLFEQLFGN
jgi:sortase A